MSDRLVVARTIYYVKTSNIRRPQVVREWHDIRLARAYMRAMRRAGKNTVKLIERHHA